MTVVAVTVLVALALILPLIASGLVSTAPTGAKTWYWQHPVPQGNSLFAVATAGTSDVWAVGQAGVVLHSGDAGLVWQSQDSGIASQLLAIDFRDVSAGLAVGAGGAVRATTDGGTTWASRTSGTTNTLFGVDHAGGADAWAVGAAGTVIHSADGGANWASQNSSTTEQLNAVAAASVTTVCAVGDNATIARTSDGGSTWTTVSASIAPTLPLLGVSFADEDTGWAVGGAEGQPATIIKTTDGGSTWTTQSTPAPDGLVLRAVTAVSTTTAWAAGDAGTVLYTTDGGATWASQYGLSAALRGIAAFDGQAAHAVGVNGRMIRTVNGGAAWLENLQVTNSNINSVSLTDTQTGWAAGDDGTLLRTTDGVAWSALVSGSSEDLLGVDFVSPTEGWAVGTAGTVLVTSDGSSWTPQTSNTGSAVNAVDFLDASTGWFAGNDATLGRTTDGGSTWTTQAASVVPTMPLLGVGFADADTGWLAGGAIDQPATVLKSVDGGVNWTSEAVPVAPGRVMRAISVVDSLTAVAVGDAGVAIQTTDGVTWSSMDVGTTLTLRGVSFADADNGWVVGGDIGEAAVIRRTSDGGSTWTTETPGALAVLRDVDATGANGATTVGDAGAILRTTDGADPVTQLVLAPAAPDGTNGWYITAPVVSFTTDEPATTFFSTNGASGPWSSYSAPWVLDAETLTTIGYYSIDPGDNRETTRTAEVRYDGGAPTTPTMLAASVTSETATLTWAGSFDTTSGLAYYEVLMDGSAVGTSAVPAITLTGLTPETETTFTVRAYDIAGNVSGESEPAEAFTLGDLPRPPAIVAAYTAYRGRVYVDWGETTGTVGPVSYRVWRGVDGGAYAAVATVAQNYPGSWVDTALAAPARASYLVSVIDARGEGPASAEATSAATTLTALPAPTALRTFSTTTSVETSWSAVPGATGYLLYRASTSTATPSLLTSPAIVAVSYTDTSAAIDTDYWYSVAAIDASGVVGAMSYPVFVHTESPATADVPHGAYDPLTDDCALCHRSHTSANEIALLSTPGDNEIPLCLSCHDGTSAPDVLDEFSDSSMVNRHPVTLDGGTTVVRCGSCHTPHDDNGGAELNKLLYAAGGVRAGNEICYQCHGATTTSPRGDLTLFEGSGHATGVPAPADGAEVVCLTCHEGHATRESSLVPFSGDDRCVWCHSADRGLAGAADIAATLSGAGSMTRHDLLAADQSANGSMITCANCHEPHVSAPGTPTVDPDSPTTADGWTGTTVGLCLRCHDAGLPTSVDTSGWAPAPLGAGGTSSVSNIASSWAGDFHGDAAATPSYLRPDMGWAAGDALSCETCHDPHGSMNRWGLAESVAASGTPAVTPGLLVVPAGAGADLRFFCGSCHIVGPSTHPDASSGGADLSAWPIDCTAGGCHTHAGSGL